MAGGWRLLDTGSGDGPYNMAVDEAILLAHSRGEVPPTLRFYGWQPPTVSIGYFQSMQGEVDLDACRRLGLGWVRRPTGGKAILHHLEITYAVVIREEFLPGGVLETYRELSKGLLAGLARLGVRAAASQEAPVGGYDSAACFEVPSQYELVAGGRKIIGSAQTRRSGTILQHGAVLLDMDEGLLFQALRVPDPLRPALAAKFRQRATSVSEAAGRPVGYAEAREAFAAGFADGLGLTLQAGDLTPAERQEAVQLVKEKYGADAWNLRK